MCKKYVFNVVVCCLFQAIIIGFKCKLSRLIMVTLVWEKISNCSAFVYWFLCLFYSEEFPLTLDAWDRLKHLSLVLRKPVFGVSDQVRHKPGCAATEDG